MGEALISRAGGGVGEDPLPVVTNGHVILATLTDFDGNIMPGYIINCKDGSTWYNYTTNDKGQALFVITSGSANFTVYNSINSQYPYIDFNHKTVDVDAPVMSSTRLNIKLDRFTGEKVFRSTTRFKLLKAGTFNIHIAGGGGGGTYTYGRSGSDEGDYYSYGAGGGNGRWQNNSVAFLANTGYTVQIGSGGSGGKATWNGKGYTYSQASAGGTSSISGTGVSISVTGGSASTRPESYYEGVDLSDVIEQLGWYKDSLGQVPGSPKGYGLGSGHVTSKSSYPQNGGSGSVGGLLLNIV